jgi:hypothetical protein
MSACEHASSSIFPDFNFGRAQPLQSVGHIGRPYAPRRVITQLHDIALLVLRDPHQYLPSYFLLLTEHMHAKTANQPRRREQDINTASPGTFPSVIDSLFWQKSAIALPKSPTL